jgi:hypothetical protein
MLLGREVLLPEPMLRSGLVLPLPEPMLRSGRELLFGLDSILGLDSVLGLVWLLLPLPNSR